MPTVRGRGRVKAYIAATPERLNGVLRGAARAGAKVISKEIEETTPSEDVREALRIRSKQEEDRIVVTIDVKPGWARSVATWLEYGTSPHFISVDDSQRDGMSVGRINEAQKRGSLVIGGHFVGGTVFHPGARPHPSFRPALDRKEAEAIATAQAYIDTRVRPSGITAGDSGGDGE